MRYAVIVLFPKGGGDADAQYRADYSKASVEFKSLKEDKAIVEKYERAEFLTKQGRQKKITFSGTSGVNPDAAIPVKVQQGTHHVVDGKVVPIEETETETETKSESNGEGESSEENSESSDPPEGESSEPSKSAAKKKAQTKPS